MTIIRTRKNRIIGLLAAIVFGLLIITAVGIYLSLRESCPALKYIGLIISAFSTISLAWVLISSLYNYVKSTYTIILGFFVLYICGIAIYQVTAGEGDNRGTIERVITNITAPVNNTLSVFFPSRGSYSEDRQLHLTASYQLFHLASYFFFALVAFSFFGRRVLNRSGHILVRYKHKNIFWGYSDNGKSLTIDLENKTLDEQAIFVLSNEIRYNSEQDNLIFDQINAMNAIALYGDYDKIDVSSRRYSGHRHFFLTENQDFNIRMALAVLDGLLKKEVITEKTHLYVRSEIEGAELFFKAKLDQHTKLSDNIEVHIYSHSDLTARQFVQNNPTLRHKSLTINTDKCEVEGRFNLLILGCGWTGRELLKKCVCDAQFPSKKFSFSATVIDSNFESQHGRYKYLFEYAKCNEKFNPKSTTSASHPYNIFINPKNRDGATVCAVNSELFYDWLNEEQNILKFDRIIVAMGNDELNITTALELTKFRVQYQTVNDEFEKIFTHVRDFDKYKYYKANESSISIFGDLRQTNSCDVLINESMDNVGKLVNFVHSKYKVPLFTDADFEVAVSRRAEIETLWNKETVFNQDSSRAVAMNIDNIVLLSGGEQEFFLRVKSDAFLNLFAEMEHLRWNAFHYMNGIRQWEIKDVTTTNGKCFFNNELIKHICLIPFDELDKASAKVNSLRSADDTQEDFKEVDRRIIRHFRFFIQYKDYSLKKDKAAKSV